MINTNNIEQAKKEIKSQKEKPIIVKAQSLEFNRKLLEYGKFDILLSIESPLKQNQFQKSLDSGLNHVLAKIAVKNNISIGIDLKELRTLSKEQKAISLSKIKQNIKICRKAKAKLALLNVKDKHFAFSLLLSLGASTQQAKQAITF